MRQHKFLYSIALVLCCSLAALADNYVIINQVMYDTPLNEVVTDPPFSNGEFIELYNGDSASVSLEGWSLSGDAYTEVFNFPSITIPSHGYLIVAYRHVNSPLYNLSSSFSAALGRAILYQNDVVLSNQGETITLYNPDDEIVDQIYYDGTSHVTKPDRLCAENPEGTPWEQCLSLQRKWAELDETGKVISGTSQWITDIVSFGRCQLGETAFCEHYITGNQSLPIGENYIISIFPLDPASRITISDNGISVSGSVRINSSISYFDGLGRPDEKIILENTPSRNDLVYTTQYTGLHRATQQWLPVPLHTEGQVQNIADVKTEAQIFYEDNKPFSETMYENSALERITGNKHPGLSWSSHPTAYAYSVNENKDNVRIYSVLNDGKLKTTGEYYDGSDLFKNTTTDEDGKYQISYTDKLGRTIMEERAGYQTYYVYDDLGFLRFVLPHIESTKLNNGEYDLADSVLQAAAYCYLYDERGNMIYKRLPGCEPQLMVYDKVGQLILKQDGNQRIAGKWTMFAYDSIGRNLYSAELLSEQDQQYYMSIFSDRWYVEHYGNNPSNTSIPGTGYASSVFPKNSLKLLTVNYYDDYHYQTRLSTAVRQALRFAQESGYGLQHEDATGLLTGTRVYNLSEDGFTANSYYYDAQGRVIQNRSIRNDASRKTAVSTEYLFDGSIAQQLSIQESEEDVVREHYQYTYDHTGRLLNTRYRLNNNDEIILSSFSYDSIGRLVQNLLHNQRDTIRYSYDLRDMLTETNNKHFSERLFYADNVSNFSHATPCYNGNISVARTLHADTTFTFVYSYDQLNRLSESELEIEGQPQPNEWFNYDARGNIIQLQRYSDNRLIDDLHFSYQQNGNQLLSIRDDGEDADLYSTIEYHNAAVQADTTMFYDTNGNLITDADRGISVIKYNILNLPDTIQFVNGNQLVNLYDASGRKYKSIVYTNIATAVTPCYEIAHYTSTMDSVEYRITEYANNVEYYYTSRDTTSKIFNASGYYSDSTYYHYIKDHLGNICAVVHSIADSAVQSTKYYASGVPMAESIGRDQQPYLYNGKEFVETHGLNEYDSQARMYYATIMRTTTMDPMSESYYSVSPYAWCGNNPVNRIDPDGRKWKTKRDAQIAQRLAKRARSNIDKQLSRMRKLQAKRTKCGSERKKAKIDRKIADAQIQIQSLGKLEKNITLLTETENNTYTFNTVNGKLATLERSDGGTMIINNYGSEGSQAHELTHAAQYENGELIYIGDNTIFQPTVAGGFLELEVKAYQTEYSISGEIPQSENGEVESVTDIDAEWVSGVYYIDSEGNKIYPYKEYRNPTPNPLSGVFPWILEPQRLGL